MAETSAGRRKRPASRRVLAGLLAGIAVGLFLGESAAILQPFADAYVKLLQMTVLPYVTGSLIAGIGALRGGEVRGAALRIVGVFALLWLVALATVFLFPLTFPAHETASFFSTTLLEPPEQIDLVNLYIPSNPFNSLANAVVPAIVLFSMILGVALIAVPNKQQLLDVLNVTNAAIARATRFIVALNPYGVFLIAAVAAGTLTTGDLVRLQLYIISYMALTLLASLWILPALVATLTTIPYRAILARTHEALITAFMTSSLIAVLPQLIEETKTLLDEHVRLDDRASHLPDIIVPTSINLPHSGKILTLSFVLFAGWYADSAISPADYPRLAGAGWLTLFGSVNMAVPFLLDLFRIPADTYQLFVATSVVNARFGTLVAAVHTVAAALLGTCAVAGLIRIERRRLVRFGVLTAFAATVLIGGMRVLFARSVDDGNSRGSAIAALQMLRGRSPATVFESADQAPPLPEPAASVLDRIRSRAVLRVGYFDDSLPYAFFNDKHELVGFDAEMAYELASDLNVKLEFVRLDREVLDRGLDPAMCDLVMSGTAVTPERTLSVLFSSSYLDETIALFILDHRRADFAEWDRIKAARGLRIGVLDAPYFKRKVAAELPTADIVPLARLEDAIAPRVPPLDAVVVTAERGSAYTLLHPEYSVVVPQPRPSKVPLAYVIAGRDRALAGAVDSWIELKRKDGTIDALFAHWILGRAAKASNPRWSVIRNVLHWVDDRP